MTLTTLPSTNGKKKALSSRALRDLARGMDRDGAVVFDGLFPKTLLQKLRRDVLRRHDSGVLKERGLIRDVGGRYAALLPFEGPFLARELYANPTLLQVLGALLGDHFCIGSLETVISLPGSSPQHQHIDGPIRFDRVIGKRKVGCPKDFSDLPPYAVGLATPLCDIDEENGPTAIWAGSHKTALLFQPPGETAIRRKYREERLSGPFGRSYLFDYRVFHGGLPNMSREPRPLLMMVFTRSWFRDPNLAEVEPSVLISKQNLDRVPGRFKYLFMLAPAARRQLWKNKK